MSESDPQLGRMVIAFPDPMSLGWGGTIGGLVTMAIGMFPVIAVIAGGNAGAPTEIDGDLIAGVLCLGSWNLIGLLIFVGGIRDLAGKPEWRIHEGGVAHWVRGRLRTATAFRASPQPTIVERRVRGNTVGYRVDVGSTQVHVPSLEVAQRVADLWRAARTGA